MEKPEAESPRSSFLSIVMAGFLAVAIFVGLFFLTLGAAAPIVAIGAVVFAVVAFHYLVWGWWLSGFIREEVEEEERR
jgi:hypothetical protein